MRIALLLLFLLSGCRQSPPGDAKKDPADAVAPMDQPKVQSPSQPVHPEKDGGGDKGGF